VIADFRSFNRVFGRYATEKQAKRRLRDLIRIIATVAVLALMWTAVAAEPTMSKHSAEIPNRFRGEWIESNDLKMKLTADSILFGSPPACKITDVKNASEDELTIEVNRHCSNSAPEVEAKVIFGLRKAWGKQVLVLVNEDYPTSISVYRRAH
jgi:hypothetical protein